MCAQMYATFENTDNPAKFTMRYWGEAPYLQTGSELRNIYLNTEH